MSSPIRDDTPPRPVASRPCFPRPDFAFNIGLLHLTTDGQAQSCPLSFRQPFLLAGNALASSRGSLFVRRVIYCLTFDSFCYSCCLAFLFQISDVSVGVEKISRGPSQGGSTVFKAPDVSCSIFNSQDRQMDNRYPYPEKIPETMCEADLEKLNALSRAQNNLFAGSVESPALSKRKSAVPLLCRIRWFNLGVIVLTPLISLYGILSTPLRIETSLLCAFYFWATMLGMLFPNLTCMKSVLNRLKVLRQVITDYGLIGHTLLPCLSSTHLQSWVLRLFKGVFDGGHVITVFIIGKEMLSLMTMLPSLYQCYAC